jgi:flavin-dependent dehydrogenase
MKEYDIAILGAGPAGAMLARLLETGGRIALLDARPLDRPYRKDDRLKSCGGLLAPDAQKFLKKHRLALPPEIIDKDQPDMVETTDFDTGITRKFRRSYLNVDREAFDRFLLKGLKTDNYFGTLVREIKKQENGFIIKTNTGISLSAKRLVGADGALSCVRRTFFPDVRFRQYASIQEVFPEKIFDGYKCCFDSSLSDYYGWTLNKKGQTCVGLAVPARRDAKETFGKFKEKLLPPQQIHSESLEGTLIIRPRFFHPVTCAGDIFLIGEAGGYISPSSAEGISYAFRTAEILAKSGFNEKSFRRGMLRIQMDILYKGLKAVFMYTPCLRRLIMRLAFWK